MPASPLPSPPANRAPQPHAPDPHWSAPFRAIALLAAQLILSILTARNMMPTVPSAPDIQDGTNGLILIMLAPVYLFDPEKGIFWAMITLVKIFFMFIAIALLQAFLARAWLGMRAGWFFFSVLAAIVVMIFPTVSGVFLALALGGIGAFVCEPKEPPMTHS